MGQRWEVSHSAICNSWVEWDVGRGRIKDNSKKGCPHRLQEDFRASNPALQQLEVREELFETSIVRPSPAGFHSMEGS
jgi:hypothetical protein